MQKQIVYVLMGKRDDPTYYDCWVQDIFHEKAIAEEEAKRLNEKFTLTSYFIETWIVS